MKTSFGIHVLDEDGAFSLGALPEQPASPASTNTMMGRSLNSTVHGLQLDPAAHSVGPGNPGDSSAGKTAFGLRAPDLSLAPGRPGASATHVGAPHDFDSPNTTMVGVSAVSSDPRGMPPTPVLGDIGDGWVDDAFGSIAPNQGASAETKKPDASPAASLPDLVQPDVPGAPGFGIMRKKRLKRPSSSRQIKPVSSAGSYENQRAEPERIVVAGDSQAVPASPRDEMPPANTSPEAFARTQAMVVGDIRPNSPAGGTLHLDVSEFAADAPAAAAPRDRLSPISVKNVKPGAGLKPLPVGGTLPKASVETPSAGSPAVGGTMVFSPSAMAGAGLVPGDGRAEVAEPPVDEPAYTADGAAFEPFDIQAAHDAAEDAKPPSGPPLDRTMAFSPSVDMGSLPAHGITPPGGEETLQLDSGAAHDFLASAAAEAGGASSEPTSGAPVRSTSVSISADTQLDRIRPPSRTMTESDDLFSVAANSGMMPSEGLAARTSVSSNALNPPHMSDARRTSPGAARQIVVVIAVLLLLAALSVLGVLIYQEFTGGASPDGPPVLEGSG